MGNSRKNKSRVFGLETFSEFSHIIKVLVNMLIPPANQTQRSISHGVLLTKKYKSRRRAKALSVTIIVKRYFRNGKSLVWCRKAIG